MVDYRSLEGKLVLRSGTHIGYDLDVEFKLNSNLKKHIYRIKDKLD